MQCNQHYLGLWFKLSLPLVLLGFFLTQRRTQEVLSTPNGQASSATAAARKGERRALGLTLILVFSPAKKILDPLLFMRKVNLIEIKWEAK